MISTNYIYIDKASGSSESWAYAKAGFPYAYIIELPDATTFMLAPNQIRPAADELLNGLLSYVKHIEEYEPDLYYHLIQNMTQPHSTESYTSSTTLSDETHKTNHLITPTKDKPNTNPAVATKVPMRSSTIGQVDPNTTPLALNVTYFNTCTGLDQHRINTATTCYVNKSRRTNQNILTFMTLYFILYCFIFSL